MRAAVAGLLSALATALAQSLDSTCTRNTWSYNREQRSPCTLWQDLTSLCTNNGSPAIFARYHHISDEYVPPREDDPCACNVVAFNLASACALCQDSFDPSDLIPETEWRASCTHYNSTGVAASQATQVKAFNLPSWAALPERGGVFQFDVARQLAAAEGITELPPATGSASTTSTRSDPASATSTDPAPSSTEKKKTDVGAIVGGVVGGLLGLAVTGLLAWLLLRYRNQQRNKTAFATAREPPSEKTFGLPSDIKVQHFVPPPSTSGHASYDSFPPSGAAGALSAHPFAANYAVQRNIQSDTVRSYTSSSNYDALAGHSIMPFDTQSATGTYSSAPNTMDVAARSGSESPFGMRSMSPTNHPYANPVVHDGYSRTTPDTPVARTSPWAAMASTEPAAAASTALPTQTPARKLPPLRVPQPVRPPSVSTAGDLSAASWSSAAPLIQPPRQSSIDEVVGNGGASKPLPRRPLPQAPSSWSHE